MSNNQSKKKAVRAHSDEGKFVADDLSTPEVNEHFEEDAQPPKKEKHVKKEKPVKKEKQSKLTRRELRAIKGEIGQSEFRRLYGKL